MNRLRRWLENNPRWATDGWSGVVIGVVAFGLLVWLTQGNLPVNGDWDPPDHPPAWDCDRSGHNCTKM